MIGMLLAAGVLMQSAASPMPSPSPSLKTITTIRATPLCAAVHVMLPELLTVVEQNRDRFPEMGRDIKNGRRWGEGPGLALAQANVDWLSAQSYEQLAEVDAILAKSYRETPTGKDAQLDALRKRAQLIIDTQRVITDSYASFAGRREVSLKYWKSIMQEADEVHRLDGDPDPIATPVATALGKFDWVTEQMTTAQESLFPLALNAAHTCGVQ